MKRLIKKAAVLGSGIMGSRIACHFANAGLEVLLLDQPAGEKGSEPVLRNKVVNDALQAAVRSNPAPLYSSKALRLIKTGNFEDDLSLLASADWIVEAIVEDPGIKRSLLERVEQFRRQGTLVTSNTSGIQLHLLAEGRSDDFRAHFCGTHFFNPPRYLPLLEIIPAPHTTGEVVDFLLGYGDRVLGKTTVLCKDTPAFIANRIGVYSMMKLLHYVEEKGLSVEEVDKYTGTLLGRPKSATFRTADVVGLDTLARVARGLYERCPDDEEREVFRLPSFMEKMLDNNWLGAKTGQGFYKKVKKDDGSSAILALRLDSMEYLPQEKVQAPLLRAAGAEENLEKRLRLLAGGSGDPAELFRAVNYPLFSYCSRRIPEIADALYRIDDAMKAGFGWQTGPFELWDALGVGGTVKAMEEAGCKPAGWVYDMLKTGCTSFYELEDGRKKYYDIPAGAYRDVPGTAVSLEVLKRVKTIWENPGVTVTDMGEGVLNCEFHTKMNTMGSEVIEGLNKAVDLAEKNFRGLVIANEGQEFSAGANLALLLMYAAEQEWEELDLMVRTFQNTMMRLRYSAIPVVAAPHNRVLGGGCELCLHADHVQAHAETYMGLVEVGAGIIPAGGGTKEFTLRAARDTAPGGIDELEVLKNRYLTIAMAKVSTSAAEAFELGYLEKGTASVSINRKRQLEQARQKAAELAAGYVQPVPQNNIRVVGRRGLGMFTVGASNMLAGNYISGHDQKISERLAWVICGGDLSEPAEVSEQYLLDLEREAFLSLCGERKSLERMQSILTGGKALRN